MPKAIIKPVRIPPNGNKVTVLEVNSWPEGIDTYTPNDEMGNKRLRLAQDARMVELGLYETRKGLDFYTAAAGETQDQANTSTAGADDKAFSGATYIAQSWTAGTTGRLTKHEVRLKNPGTATGTVIVEHWTDSGGSPGEMVSRSSIAAADVPGSNTYMTARFVDAPIVTSGTTYWIVAYVQATGSNSYSWSSTTAATSAKVSVDFGGTWDATAFSMNFKQHYATNSPPKGLFKAVKSDGTSVTLIAHGTSLYSVNDITGALTAIKTGLSASATHYRFAQVNDIVYYVNGFDGYRKWDFTTESQVNATNYTLIMEHKGLMFLVRKDDPNRVDFSNFGEYETFTSTDFIYIPSPKTSDPVTGLAPLNGTLQFFCRRNRYVLYGDDNATFSLEMATTKRGTYSQESMTAVDNSDANFIYFVGTDGVYRTDGTSDKLLSARIYETFRTITNKRLCVVTVDRGRLYVYYTAVGSSVNNSCIVFNLNFDCVESFDTDTYVAFTTGAVQDSNLIVASSLIGQAYYQEANANDYTNLGGDLDYELRTHYMTFGAAAVVKAIRKWKARFAAQSGNYTATIGYATDYRTTDQTASTVQTQGAGPVWGSGIIWGSFTWGSTFMLQASTYVPGEYERIQFRYRHHATRQPQKFLGHTVVAHARRLR